MHVRAFALCDACVCACACVCALIMCVCVCACVRASACLHACMRAIHQRRSAWFSLPLVTWSECCKAAFLAYIIPKLLLRRRVIGFGMGPGMEPRLAFHESICLCAYPVIEIMRHVITFFPCKVGQLRVGAAPQELLDERLVPLAKASRQSVPHDARFSMQGS